MIKKLILRNFQIHKSLTIRLDKYVTTLTGPNDAGKSAVIRAIRWTAFNRPSGRCFVRRGANFCKGILRTSRGEIQRSIGKGSNLYRYKGKAYKAFRSSVPADITGHVNLSEINIQRQHDPYFWFSLSPGAVAKELNKLVDLDSIDRVQANIAKELRDKKAELEVARKRLQDAKAEIKRLRGVDRLNVNLGKLETGWQRMARKRATLAAGSSLVSAGSHHAATQRDAATAAASGLLAVSAGRLAMRLAGRSEKLRQIVARLQAGRLLVGRSVPKLPPFPNLDTSSIRRLESLILSHKGQGERLCHCQKQQQKIQRRLYKLSKGLRRCPVCGQKIKKIS